MLSEKEKQDLKAFEIFFRMSTPKALYDNFMSKTEEKRFWFMKAYVKEHKNNGD